MNERVYNGYPVTAQQKCLAHMRRHFLRLIKCPGKDNAAIGQVFVDLIDDVFDNYRSWIASHDITAYIDWATRLKSKLTNAFNQWIPQAGATALNLLLKLRDKYDQWWYFLDHPEIPPDNNLAERSLRLAVTKRKVSGGSRSLSLVWRYCKPLNCCADVPLSATLCYRLLCLGITRVCWS